MPVRSSILAGLSVALIVGPASTAGVGHTTVGRSEQPRPRISSRVASNVRARLEAGFDIALDRLHRRAECRELFAELGEDGVGVLSRTLYYPADLAHERQLCHGALAFTMVGAAPTWVCHRVCRLPDHAVAVMLLHEALHHAGLDEWPHDPRGLRPRAIDRRVRRACGL
jgi:hypothetical protein